MQETAVEHGVEGVVVVEPGDVGGAEGRGQAALGRLARGAFDGAGGEVDARHAQAASRDGEGQFSGAAPGVQHVSFAPARVDQFAERRLGLADVPGDRAVPVHLLPLDRWRVLRHALPLPRYVSDVPRVADLRP
ncbi:hypothetical protein BJF79_07990 [Actinomadura sp. CNU-125]|nr:hypothetical protein BJF79_07990 [Actinomadura sp. CNU-125]